MPSAGCETAPLTISDRSHKPTPAISFRTESLVQVISFSVPGVPVAQPRQRQAVRNGFVANYTPAKHPVNVFKAACQLAVREAYDGPPLEGPLSLDLVFVMPRPSSKVWKTRPMPRLPHSGKPDRDNLIKSFQDALEGLLFRNDSQICAGSTVKVIAAGDEQPHVEATIRVLTDEEVI